MYIIVKTIWKRFKPCYKWITFNTNEIEKLFPQQEGYVLNLVINGLPSIHNICIKIQMMQRF